MINSKLLETCKSLTNEELDRFELFLESKFLNPKTQPKKIIQLFQHIKQTILNKEKQNWSKDLTKAQTFQILFPQEVFSSLKLEKIMSKLFNLLKYFIVLEYSEIQQNETLQLLTLSRFYRERGLDQQFDLNIKKLKKLQQKITTHDEDFFKNQYQIEEEIGENKLLYNNRNSDANLIHTFDKLELWQLVHKLRFLIQIHLQKIHVNISLEHITIQPKDINRLLKKKPEWDFPIVKVYQHAFKLLFSYPDDNIEELENLRMILQQNEDHFPANEVYKFQSIIRTLTIKKYNEGNKAYLPLAFNIYKEHLKAGYLYKDNLIHTASFINIVIAGLRLNEVEWVATFIRAHTHRILGSKNPKAIVSFTLALLHFTKKEYDKALDLVNFDYKDNSLKIASKRLEIKIYFEQQSLLLEHRLNAFKVYIFRLGKKHLTVKEKLSNNHFIDVIRQIIHNKTFLNAERVAKIYEKTEKLELLADREWLLEQMRLLK